MRVDVPCAHRLSIYVSTEGRKGGECVPVDGESLSRDRVPQKSAKSVESTKYGSSKCSP